MMKRLYRLLRGTARLEISGAEPEQVLNRCAENDIEFWDAVPCDEFTLRVTVWASDKQRVIAHNGKNGIDIRRLSENGGRVLRAAAKSRVWLLVFMAANLVLLSVSSLFLWSIEIEGTEKLSDAAVLRALEECGVYYGAFWPEISSDAVKNEMAELLPEIAWITVNVRSSGAHILVRERVPKPEIFNEKTPGDIVASKSGVVRNMTVLRGRETAAKGSVVCAGDVIVSGIISSETGQAREVHSSARIIADTWYEISAQSPLYELKKRGTAASDTKISLLIGKMRINFFSDSRNEYASCDKINKLKYISLGKTFVLPVGYAIQSTTQTETRLEPIDEAETAERLKQSLRAELKDRIGDGQIVSEKFTVSKTDSVLTVTMRAQCSENIAKEQPYDRTNDRG